MTGDGEGEMAESAERGERREREVWEDGKGGYAGGDEKAGVCGVEEGGVVLVRWRRYCVRWGGGRY